MNLEFQTFDKDSEQNKNGPLVTEGQGNDQLSDEELLVDKINVIDIEKTEQALIENEEDNKNENEQVVQNEQIVENEEEEQQILVEPDDKQEEVQKETQNQNEQKKNKKKQNKQDKSDKIAKNLQKTLTMKGMKPNWKQNSMTPKRDNKPNLKVQQKKVEKIVKQDIKPKDANIQKQKYEQVKRIKNEYQKNKDQDQQQQVAKSCSQKLDLCLDPIKKDSLLQRKCWRIFLLILIVFGSLAIILVNYYKLGFIRGARVFKDNEKQVQMNINSCTMMIYDKTLQDSELLDTNFLSGTLSGNPSHLEDNEAINMQWIYPDAPVYGRDSSFKEKEEDNINTFTFNNAVSDFSCEIVLYVYKEIQFDVFNIDCGEQNECNIIIYSKLFSSKNMKVEGENVQMNAPYLNAETFEYESMKGQIEIPFFIFNTANIKTREGDISIQSNKDIHLTFFQKDPFNCLSAKKILNASKVKINNFEEFQKQITQEKQEDCKKVFPYKVDEIDSNIDKLIEYRCYKGEVYLLNKEQAESTLNLQNSFGNINVNIVTESGKWPIQRENDVNVVFNKAHKQEDTQNTDQDYINLSTQSQIELTNKTDSAQDPSVYNPMFVYYFGPKFTRSNTFQQLHVSYNPAYTYVKPYWLGELTVTLMSSQQYSGQYNISPGFCPYVPSLSLDRMHSTQKLVKEFMQSKQAPQYAKTSTAWQADIDYPPQKYIESDSYYGFRKISNKRYYDEQWIEIQQDKQHINQITDLNVSQNNSLFAAIIVSCILAVILGMLLMVLLVFAINQNYIQILNHVSRLDKYTTFEKGGEIDTTTLTVEQQRILEEYTKFNKDYQDQTDDPSQEVQEHEQKERGIQPKYTITNIFGLFYQLVYLSPPLCAFIDYIVLLLHKARQNSIQEFYNLLFRKKSLKQLKEDDEEIHNLKKDQIYGNEMKQFYEKFCYLNSYLERNFNDDENLKFLTERGFKIVTRYDSQSQYFTFIKYNQVIPNISDQSNKSTIDLFITNCCSLTKFETDRIEFSVLDEIYQEFCSKNHFQKQQIIESQLKRDYGIQTTYLPQQWVERDNKYDVQKQKVKYFIDKKRVENNFKILLAKDPFLFNILYDSEDIKEVQNEIKLTTGWQLFDLITVVAHILTMVILGSPLVLLTIFLRVQQSHYSLVPPNRLIYLETIKYYPSSIPLKLMNDNWIVQSITIIAVIFWGLSFLDLIYYYASMDFPQEKYFNQYKHVGKVRKFLSGIQWVIVLIALFSTAVYFSLVAIWLILSAIINPNAFLPYATSAATFITLVAQKYKEFQEVYQSGFKKLQDYLLNLATGQFQDLLKKMNIQDQIADIIPTDTIKEITSEAAKLGIIDSATCEDITNNLEVMIRDPNTISKLGSELMNISKDPNAFAAQMTQKLEEKAKSIIQQQVQTIDKDLRDNLVNLFWCLLKNQKSELKNIINSFVGGLINVFQKQQEDQQFKNIGFINLNGPLFDFIWEYAFPQENFKENYQDHLTKEFCVALSNFIQVYNREVQSVIKTDTLEEQKNTQQTDIQPKQKQTKEEIYKQKLQKEVENFENIMKTDIIKEQERDEEIEETSEGAITFAYKNIIYSVIQICRANKYGNSEVILNQIHELIQNTSKLPGFEGLKSVKQYQDIFKIGYAIFKNDGHNSQQEVSLAFKDFLKNIGIEEEVKKINGVGFLDIQMIIEVIIQSFQNQNKPQSIQYIKKVISNILGSTKYVQKRKWLQNQEFTKLVEIDDINQCLNMKQDVESNLKEIKDTILDLEQYKKKIIQNEEYYKSKFQTSIEDMQYYCRVILREEINQTHNEIEEMQGKINEIEENQKQMEENQKKMEENQKQMEEIQQKENQDIQMEENEIQENQQIQENQEIQQNQEMQEVENQEEQEKEVSQIKQENPIENENKSQVSQNMKEIPEQNQEILEIQKKIQEMSQLISLHQSRINNTYYLQGEKLYQEIDSLVKNRKKESDNRINMLKTKKSQIMQEFNQLVQNKIKQHAKLNKLSDKIEPMKKKVKKSKQEKENAKQQKRDEIDKEASQYSYVIQENKEYIDYLEDKIEELKEYIREKAEYIKQNYQKFIDKKNILDELLKNQNNNENDKQSKNDQSKVLSQNNSVISNNENEKKSLLDKNNEEIESNNVSLNENLQDIKIPFADIHEGKLGEEGIDILINEVLYLELQINYKDDEDDNDGDYYNDDYDSDYDYERRQQKEYKQKLKRKLYKYQYRIQDSQEIIIRRKDNMKYYKERIKNMNEEIIAKQNELKNMESFEKKKEDAMNEIDIKFNIKQLEDDLNNNQNDYDKEQQLYETTLNKISKSLTKQEEIENDIKSKDEFISSLMKNSKLYMEDYRISEKQLNKIKEEKIDLYVKIDKLSINTQKAQKCIDDLKVKERMLDKDKDKEKDKEKGNENDEEEDDDDKDKDQNKEEDKEKEKQKKKQKDKDKDKKQNQRFANKEVKKSDDSLNSLPSSCIAFMLNFFSGSISNISSDLIKEFGLYLKQFSEQYDSNQTIVFLSKKICSSSQVDNNKPTGENSEAKQKLNSFQNLLNLMEIFINDTTLALEKIKINGIHQCNISESLIYSLQTLLTVRFDGVIGQEAINHHLKRSQLLGSMSKVMKIKKDVILGLMDMIIGFKQSKHALRFINFATNLNKVHENKISTIINLYNLYSSTNPSELYNALSFFEVTSKIPQQYSSCTIKDLVKAILFMRGSLDFDYVQTIFEGQLKFTFSTDQSRQQQKSKIQQIKEKLKEMKETKETKEKKDKKDNQLPLSFKKLLEINHKGYLKVSTIKDDFQAINKNLKILLDDSDLEFFKKFVSIRNISKFEEASQTILLKSTISDISEILNIDYSSVDFFLNLLTSSKPNKLQQSLDLLNLKEIDPNIQPNSISNFVDYSSYVLEKLEQRTQNIINIQTSIFKSFHLPLCILKKILYTDRYKFSYEDYITLFLLYCDEKQKPDEKQQPAETQQPPEDQQPIENQQPVENQQPAQKQLPQISESIQSLIDFKFGLVGKEEKDIYRFLISNKTEKDFEKKYLEFMETSAGLLKVIQIISIDNESLRIKIFLQYLIQTKKEALLLMSCLLVFFSGRSNNITLIFDPSYKQNGKSVTIEQLLSQLLQVKIEFFEAIRTFFSEDLIACSTTMIKFYRQLDYQSQLDSQNKKDGILLENNITLSEKTVEQFYKLANNKQINISFFSKELNIPIEVVELISCIAQIKNAKNLQERQVILDTMRNNSQITKVLQQIGVNLQEFISLIKIMYQDYEPTNIQWVSNQLKLNYNFKVDGLQQLIMLDQDLPIYGQIQQNQTILNLKVKAPWTEVAYILTKGQFNLLSNYKDELIALKHPSKLRFEEIVDRSELKQERSLSQVLNINEKQYMSLIQGLTGLLSCKNSQFLTTEYLYQLYTTLRKDYFKEKNITVVDGLKKGNTLQYAIYEFTKSTYISPVWTLLMIGDFNAWQNIAEKYYLVNDGNQEFLHPIVILVYVINFRANPLIVKELLVNLEFAQRSYQIQIAKIHRENIENQLRERQQSQENKDQQNQNKIDEQDINIEFSQYDNENINEYEVNINKLKIEINEILTNCIELDAEKLVHLAEDFNFPKSIMNMILNYENEYNQKYLQIESENKFTNQMINSAFENIQKKLEIIRSMDDAPYEYQQIELINEIFKFIDTEFYKDPRKENFDIITEENKFTQNYCLDTFTSSPIMQMTVLSTIAQLRHSYQNFYGFTRHDDDHYKQVTFAIDQILGILEKYYYFDDMIDLFPRHRLIPLIGLSVGFVIETDDIVASMTSQNIFDFDRQYRDYYDIVISPVCNSVYEKLSNEEEKQQNEGEIQKFIKLTKFNQKYEFFSYKMVSKYCKQQILDNYDYRGGFKGIYQSQVKNELEKKNIQKLINHFEDYMWSTYEARQLVLHVADSNNHYSNNVKLDDYYSSSIETMNDFYSGEKYKIVLEKIDEFYDQENMKNFRLLVDIFKGNYKSLNNNEHFATNYAQDLSVYYGILFINGITTHEGLDVKLDEFQQSITQTSLNMQSSTKPLTEILSMFINSIKTNFSSIAKQSNVNEEYIGSFIDLAIGKSRDQSQDLNNLLKKSPLSTINKRVLKNCIQALQGKMSEYLKLIDCSSLFKEQYGAKSFFSQFLWSFEKSKMHTITNNPNEVSYFDYCNLSPNRAEALEQAQKYLWEISVAIYYQKSINDDKKLIEKLNSQNQDNIKKRTLSFQDQTRTNYDVQTKDMMNDKKTDNQEVQLLEKFEIQQIFKGNKKIIGYKISMLLQKILYNDWNFLFNKNIRDFQLEFDTIFQSGRKEQMEVQAINEIKEITVMNSYGEILKFFVLLKPERCNLKMDNQIYDDNITNKQIDRIFELGKKLEFKMFNNNDDMRQTHLMLSLSSNSIVHILNCYNKNEEEWNYDYFEQNADKEVKSKVQQEFKKNNKGKLDNKKKQQELFKTYEKLKKLKVEELSKKQGKKIPKESEYKENSKYKNVAYILQSLYLWKNISYVDWESMFKNYEQFIENPYEKKDLKSYGDFTYSLIDYLSILPSIFQYDSDSDKESTLNELIQNTFKDYKLDENEKKSILKQIDSLLQCTCKGLRGVDDTVLSLIYAIFYLITGQETERMDYMDIKNDKQECFIILLKAAFENPNLSEYFFGTVKSGDGTVVENFDNMINTIESQLQQILNKPSLSINDFNQVKEVLKLIKYSSKGTVDVSIIEDVICILTGDYERIFNILRKFEVIDENKILLIERAYNQVANMPIFNNKDKGISAGPQNEQSDIMKDIVKKLEEGKATIKDVFYAVDNEGDNNGTISIDEFQSFVRRLGMELSRHRVHEIFAYTKNTRLKPGSYQKQEQLTLNEEEFDKAFRYVNDKKTSMSLEMLGISPALLALALGTLIVILILLFVFIFLGINAFTVGGTFGAIINSIIPMAAASGAAGSQGNKKDNIDQEKVKSAVQDTQSIIHSNHL